VTVFAAASLTDAFEGLRAPWSAAHPGSELIMAFDSSSALRALIEQGAPADVFAAADTEHPGALIDGCLARGPVTAFAHNTLVVVVPSDDPASIASPADLARPGVRIVAAGPRVPITRYVAGTLSRLAEQPGYPPGFAAAVAANVVSEEDNVRAVLARVELGEADAAIVYATDAAASDAVATIEIPAEANARATYGAVTLVASPRLALAETFLDFLIGAQAQAVLARHGFLPSSSSTR
jgi:molybdate transport system substrate-binding protein